MKDKSMVFCGFFLLEMKLHLLDGIIEMLKYLISMLVSKYQEVLNQNGRPSMNT